MLLLNIANSCYFLELKTLFYVLISRPVSGRETAYDVFRKASELKCLRVVNKAVFGQLLQSTLPDIKRKRLRICGSFRFSSDTFITKPQRETLPELLPGRGLLILRCQSHPPFYVGLVWFGRPFCSCH